MDPNQAARRRARRRRTRRGAGGLRRQATAAAAAPSAQRSRSTLDPRHDRHGDRARPGRLLRPGLLDARVQPVPDAGDGPAATPRRSSATPPSRATTTTPQTLTCTLNPGEKFSNGDPLTSSDVKYSFERAIKIQDPNGAAIYLLGSITDTAKDGTVTLNKGAIETPDDPTVVFHLDHPDTTFQYVLTYPGAGGDRRRGRLPGRQEAGRRPGHRLRPLQAEPVQVRRAGRARAQRELHGPEHGQDARRSSSSTTREPSALKLAVQNGEVDVAWRQPGPDRHRRPSRRTATSPSPPARAPRSATGSGTSTAASASSSPSARPRPRSSTATRSPRTPTTARSTRCTRSCRRATAGQNDAFKDAVRRARHGQGQADPAGRRHQHAGQPHRGLDAHPLRPEHRGRGQRVPAPARGQRPVQGRP